MLCISLEEEPGPCFNHCTIAFFFFLAAPRGLWDFISGPGIEPLQGCRVLTTGPLGNSLHYCFLIVPLLFLHSFLSLSSSCLNLPLGTQGRSRETEAFNLQIRNGEPRKAFMLRRALQGPAQLHSQGSEAKQQHFVHQKGRIWENTAGTWSL